MALVVGRARTDELLSSGLRQRRDGTVQAFPGQRRLQWFRPILLLSSRRVLAGDYLRRGVAEFVGTFALIFVGAGAVIYGDLAGTALANGLVIAVMVTSVGMISGGFFNPAITIAFALTRRISVTLAAWYLLVQLGAAALAALLLKWVIPAPIQTPTHLGAPGLLSSASNGHVSAGQGVAIEAVLTFFLVWVVFATVVDARNNFKQVAGLAIGLTITLDVLMGFGLTGAAVNPARAFGPQLVANHWSHFWVWYVGPIAGGAIAALLYEGLYLTPAGPKPLEQGAGDSAPGTAALD
jgi:aquaporin TIP